MAVELMVVVLVYGSSAGGGPAVWYCWCMAVEVVVVVYGSRVNGGSVGVWQ